MRVPTGVMLLTFSPSSGPAGHLPPCGGKALRAATWGRPYENFGPLLPVGADLRVRPPLLGAHIGAPLHSGAPGRSSSWPGGPQARRGNPHPPQRKTDPAGLSAPRNGRGRRVKDAAPYRVRTICRGRCPHRPAAAAAFGGPKAFSFRAGPGVPQNGRLRNIKQNEK